MYKIVVVLLALVPAISYFYSFFAYAVNVPVNDDYRALLQFVNSYVRATSVSEKFKAVFLQNAEHRIVFQHLCALLNYKFTGAVNFIFLSFVGNLALGGIFLIYNFELTRKRMDWFYLLPTSVLLFNLSFWENTTFSMAALSNFTAPFFSICVLYLLASPNPTTRGRFVMSAVLTTACIFTQGGGLFLVPVSLLVFAIKREYKLGIIYLLFCIVILLAYFRIDYHLLDGGVDYLNILINYKAKLLLFAFSFMGSAFNYFLIYTGDLPESVSLSGLLGGGLFSFFVYLTLSGYYRKNLFVYSSMLLVIAFAFVTALNRQHLGIDTSGASRYRINSVILLIGVLFWLSENLDTKFCRLIVMTLTIIYFTAISLPHLEYFSFRKKELLMGALNYQAGNYSKLPGFEQELYKEVLADSKGLGTFELNLEDETQRRFPYSPMIPADYPEQNGATERYSMDDPIEVFDSYIVQGWAFPEGGTPEGQRVFVGLKPDSGEVNYFLAKQEIRKDLEPYFKRKNLETGGFLARIRFSDVKAKNSKIFVKIVQKGKAKTFETGKQLNAAHQQ